MRLLFVADGRSPTALNWIDYFLDNDYEVHLVSTFDCTADVRFASFNIVPVAFSRVKPAGTVKSTKRGWVRGLWSGSLLRARTIARQWLGPLSLPKAASQLRDIVSEVQPDLVHAMRIPYEGMITTLANPDAPILISVWGNDFTLHAPATPLMAYYTRATLRRADALQADCRRDIRLAGEWGFSPSKPTMVLPGGGGVQPDLFYLPVSRKSRGEKGRYKDEGVEESLTVINPRGLRAYVRNDVFFQAIPLVLAHEPQTQFLCPAMAGEPQVERWLKKFGIRGSVELLPQQKRSQMARLYQRSRVFVSPSTHDGTPNTLLEAMACGCIPVVGDIESLREWITNDVNGLLVDPTNPRALSQAILTALRDSSLWERAQLYNLPLVAERADYKTVMDKARSYYRTLWRKQNRT